MEGQVITNFYEFGEFRLDVPNRLLWQGEKQIALTPKEFDVLLVLVENAGRVLTKDELLETIWKDTFVEEATLARNVSWLRKKLATNGNTAKFIETLPKRGYRFSSAVTKGGEQPAVIVEEPAPRASTSKKQFPSKIQSRRKSHPCPLRPRPRRARRAATTSGCLRSHLSLRQQQSVSPSIKTFRTTANRKSCCCRNLRPFPVCRGAKTTRRFLRTANY
jgi:DNA-binding winged helix-turn-helix (wHTH) protein